MAAGCIQTKIPNAYQAWCHLAQVSPPLTHNSSHTALPSGLPFCGCLCLDCTCPHSLLACSFSSFRPQRNITSSERPSLTTPSIVASHFLHFPYQIPYSLFWHPIINSFVDLCGSIYNIPGHILTITTL